ncbi:MAG: hypothetical protein ABJA74_13810 [Lapillicoccus sp.]
MGDSPSLSRRLLLQGAALSGAGAAVGGCASSPDAADGRSRSGSAAAPVADSGAASASPDVRLVESAIADERALLDDCLAGAATFTGLAPVLDPIAARQREHLARLRAALTSGAPGRPSHPRRVPGDRAAALRRVRRSVVDAQRARRTDALAADSGPLARLLASMSASHAVTADLDALSP